MFEGPFRLGARPGLAVEIASPVCRRPQRRYNLGDTAGHVKYRRIRQHRLHPLPRTTILLDEPE